MSTELIEILKGMTAEQQQELIDSMRPRDIVFADQKSTGKPRATLENFKTLLKHYSITVRYNEMTKELEINIPREVFHADTEMNAKLAFILDLCNRHDFPPGEIDAFLTLLANRNYYHPVREYIDVVEWDGVDRLSTWYNSIVLAEANPMKNIILYKWALSCVAALYQPNFSCEGVLTLQSPQGTGKTISIENIIPQEYHNKWNKDACVIDMNNKDTIFKALGYWITELGEVDATFRKSDMEALKGFITEKFDVLRPPYERKANKYPRRTVMYATVNELEFLQDSENRRFWILCVKEFRHVKLDVAQFWAQLKVCYMNIKDKIRTAVDRETNQEWGWFMSPRERAQMKPLQQQFKSQDPIEHKMDAHIQARTGAPYEGQRLNITQILEAVSWNKPSKRDLNIAGKWLRDHGFDGDGQKRYEVILRGVDTFESDDQKLLQAIANKRKHTETRDF
jgi:putative DNA primase/helicase